LFLNTNIELSDLLGRSLDDIADDIESQLAAHVARHGMAAAGQRWIAEGVAFIAADECPFCGRAGVSQLELIRAYKEIFSESYKSLRAEIESTKAAVHASLGEVAQARLQTLVSQNKGASEFWQKHCTIKPAPPLDPMLQDLQRAHAILELLPVRLTLA
jgi:wobble nucleotide-excising tRNase